MNDRERVRALPVWAGADPPPVGDQRASDVRSFADVVRVFLRTWPFLKPMFLGRWYEFGSSGDASIPPLANARSEGR